MISPRTAPRVLGDSATLGRVTPHRGMRELRLEVGLLELSPFPGLSCSYLASVACSGCPVAQCML